MMPQTNKALDNQTCPPAAIKEICLIFAATVCHPLLSCASIHRRSVLALRLL